MKMHALSCYQEQGFTRNKDLKALKDIHGKKSAEYNDLCPFLLKFAASIIIDPKAYIFNLTVQLNIWKALVLPLLKRGDPSSLNNYCPISKLSVPSKILGKLVCEQLKEFLYTNDALSEFQSGFRKKHNNCNYESLK